MVVGAGHAGVQFADSLRSGGFEGAISLVDEQPAQPYQRPPLSKDFLAEFVGDGCELDALPLRAPRFFEDAAIELRRGMRVAEIDRGNSELVIATAGGGESERVRYDRLVLATGAENRALGVPGAGAVGIFGLRTLADARALRQALTTARNVVVVGAGFIGLEFAAAVRERGVNVTVLEYAPRAMSRATSPLLGEWIEAAHRGAGVELHFDSAVVACETDGSGRVTAVRTQGGGAYSADLVLYGIGVLPRVGLAERAGLEVGNGIVVDGSLRSSDPRIYAIGDCANFPYRGVPTRLEAVQNAGDQARYAARHMLTGAEDPFDALPVFWSHQGSVKLHIAGLTRADDEYEVVGDPNSGKFSVRSYRLGRLAAVESVGDARAHMNARRELHGIGR
ncbi:hypothetical protein ASF88_01810 [Leifsonia sp. Leaf336]|nr:hypothetical protein ASF88_01810 [Leifsonia sp. Leaf336]